MRLRIFACLAAAFAVTASLAQAQDDMVIDPAQAEPMQAEVSDDDSVAADYGKGCCEDVCCDQSSFVFGVEATFFRYTRADGVGQGANGGDFDYELSPRLTLGYVGCDGLGARLRYWEYDHEATINAANYSVNTYNLDFEVFQTVELGSCTTVEFMGGVRYNDFEQITVRDGNQSFDGIGGILGVQAHRDLCGGLGLYARLREVIMVGDWSNNGDLRNDTTRPVTEIALGVDYTSCNWSLNAGFEWQNWGNYASDQFDVQQQTEDAGFVGFVVGAGYSY